MQHMPATLASSQQLKPILEKLSLLSVTRLFGGQQEILELRLRRYVGSCSNLSCPSTELLQPFTQPSCCVVVDLCGNLWQMSITPADSPEPQELPKPSDMSYLESMSPK